MSWTLRTHRVPSQILREVRLVRVLMPDEPRGLLFLNDGQNLFTKTRTVGTPERWRADEAVRVVPDLAIVGIDNAGRHRGRDYLPYPNPADPLGRRPQGDRYVAFVVDELLGWVARRYPQLTRLRHVGIGGSSPTCARPRRCRDGSTSRSGRPSRAIRRRARGSSRTRSS